MISTENILTVARKELKGYFDNPTAYIVLIVFLLLWEWLFFRNAFVVGEASLRGLFDLFPWLALLLVPALTMSTLAQERSEGTLELLLTHPLRDGEVLLGKLAAAVGLVALALAFAFPLAFSFSQYGSVDWGMVVGQYFAGLMLVAVLASLGVFVSSLFTSPIAAMLVTAAGGFVMVISGSEIVTATLPPQASLVAERLSVMPHFTSMARGVIDVRDLWYLVSATVIFTGLAYWWLHRSRLGGKTRQSAKFQVLLIIFIGVVVAVNIYGWSGSWRLDLTSAKQYTMAPETKQVLRQVPDDIKLTLYASSQLPAQLQPVLRDIKDTLEDYRTVSGGKLTVEFTDPGAGEEAAQAAQANGVQAVQFNVVGQQELQVKTGYLGLVIARGDQKEALPFISDTVDLEYELTSNIKMLSAEKKKKALVMGTLGEAQAELAKQYEIETVFVSKDAKLTISDDAAVLILAGQTQPLVEEEAAAVKDYLSKGGAVMVLAEGVTVNPQYGTATAADAKVYEWLKEYGITVNQDLAYDLRSNEVVNVGGGGPFGVAVQYPLWPRALVRGESMPAVKGMDTITLPWASTISLDDGKIQEKKLAVEPLLVTSKFGGKQTENFSIEPTTDYSRDNLGEQILGVSVKGANESGFGRLAVIGDADFVFAQMMGDSGQAAPFTGGIISWLTGEETLTTMQARRQARKTLMFESASQMAFVKYGNLVLAVGLPLALGGYRWRRRRLMESMSYCA